MTAPPPQGLPIRLTNGINTKDDELVQQEMLNLENGTFQRPGSLRKRYGMTCLAGPSTSARRLVTYDTELLVVADDGLFSRVFNPTDGWSASRGTPSNTRTDDNVISADFNSLANGGSDNRGIMFSDMVIAGGMVFIAWLEYNTGQYQCYVTVYDQVTGAQYLSHAIAGGTSQAAQLRWTTAGTNVYLYVAGNTTSAARFTFSALAAPTVMPTPSVNTFTDNPVGPFDITARTDGVGAIAVQAGGTGYLSIRINNGSPVPAMTQSAGSVIATATNQVRQLAIYADTVNPGWYWVAWGESNSGGTVAAIKVMAVDGIGTVKAAATTVANLTNGTLPLNVGVIYSPTIQGPIVFWEDDFSNAGTPEAGKIQHVSFTLSGTTLTARASAQLDLLWGKILSKPFLIGTDVYVWIGNRSNTTLNTDVPFYASAFLLKISPTDLTAFPKPQIVAQALRRSAPSRGLTNGTPYIATPSQVTLVGNDMYLAIPKMIGTNSRTGSASIAPIALYAPCVVHCALQQFPDTAQLTQSLCIGNSIVQSYDGAQLVELNFLAPPDGLTLTTASTGGSLSNGSYEVIAIYEWVDANGEIQQSLPSNPSTITLSGGTSTQTIVCSVRCVTLSRKTGVLVRFYASLTNQQTLFMSAVQSAQIDSPTNSSTTGLAVATITAIGTFPAYTNATLANDAPQPTNFIARVSDRVWGHAGQGILELSKKRIVTHAAEFSGLLTQQLSSFLIPNAIAELSGNRQLVFADESMAAFDGDGPDNTGNGTFNDDELVSRSIGCSSQRNLVRWDGGVLFDSKKGWYNCDDGLNNQYVGNKVESYNGLTPAGVAYDPVSNRIKVALQGAGNPILVYDTYAGTWSLETSSAGINVQSIVFWRDAMQLLDVNGYVWSQIAGTFTDNGAAIVMRGRTGWIAPEGLQSWMRIQEVLFQGKKRSDHTLRIALRYDYKEAIAESFAIDAGPAVAITDDYQWRIIPKVQQCKAVSVEFWDDYSVYSPGEGYSLDEISLTVTTEGGNTRTPSIRTVKGS